MEPGLLDVYSYKIFRHGMFSIGKTQLRPILEINFMFPEHGRHLENKFAFRQFVPVSATIIPSA
jgi:hypothetical protein